MTWFCHWTFLLCSVIIQVLQTFVLSTFVIIQLPFVKVNEQNNFFVYQPEIYIGEFAWILHEHCMNTAWILHKYYMIKFMYYITW